ncbi:MAG: SWIM zinc finger family protein [Myxococcota bacterium]
MTESLEPSVRVLHGDVLKQLTESPSFRRGEQYFREGRVGNLTRNGNTIRASVRGSRLYDVQLWVKGDQLAYSCTCPVAEQGLLCKHCIAVALAWIVPMAEAAKAQADLADAETGVSSTPPEEVEQPVLRPPGPQLSKSRPPKARPTPAKTDWRPGRVHAWLRAQDSVALADLILDQAATDPGFQARLMALLDE